MSTVEVLPPYEGSASSSWGKGLLALEERGIGLLEGFVQWKDVDQADREAGVLGHDGADLGVGSTGYPQSSTAMPRIRAK